ncbi:hypothetical protein KC19_1G175700 [Ceratodon purpureus]|uniref:Cyclic nucleotide-binding domain-containing protein n=1 Tax=Ceratodon purpureus TaxID=3225 RepID=A0A8T0J678_CERPU|nr:hypothetical protein KC19_1G175700 [Ceratodon purpureus]
MSRSVDDFEYSDEEDDDGMSTFSLPSLTLPVVRNWRGIAHYRTWSRRRVLMKPPEKRTQSELYLLEETVAELEPIASLPHSLRLEVCRYLGYRKLDPNTILCKQGDIGYTLFIVFTGSVKAYTHVPGQQEDSVTTYGPGHWFGETVFEKTRVIWDSTFSTAERTEVLTLSKEEYEKILNIPGTEELKARLQFLKGIHALKEVSKQSLRRLANVLTSRTFHKNRVITFQGDDASEMFFIRTGECRVVMEIQPRERTPTLPRAASAQSQYWPNCHQKCRQEIHDREKEWWRPSLVSRPSTRGSRIVSRCHSQPTQPVLPEGLPKEIMSRPDVIYRMLTHQKTPKSGQIEPKKCSTTNEKVSRAKRPCTAPSPKPNSSAIKKKASIICSEEGDPLSPWRASPDMAHTRSTTRASNRSSQGFHASFADSTPEPASTREYSKSRSTSSTSARFKSPSAMQDRKRKLQTVKKRSPVTNKKYSFSTFVKDCEEKEKSKKVEDVEFSEKENKLWQMGLTTTGMMPAVFMTNENRYYQRKFTKWARTVMDREKKLLSFDTFEGTTTPSFMPGLPQEGIVKLEQSHTPQPKRATPEDAASKTTMSATGSTQSHMSTILDIGALIDGQYFGERGLLMDSKRAASVVAVSLVETLVLNKWDFHRHCDRDVIRALAKHQYKREEEIYHLYMRTRKWEIYKKQVVEDICNAKSARKSTRRTRPVRVVRRPDGRSIEIPLKEWAY